MKKKYTKFRPSILSRHPSHNVLRRNVNKEANWLLPFRSLIRFGSTTPVEETKMVQDPNRIELNSIEAIRNSSNKLRMKNCFHENEVKTALWWTIVEGGQRLFNQENYQGENGGGTYLRVEELPYPIVVKHKYGSRGRGNTKINTEEDMTAWLDNTPHHSNYIFEVFHNFSREYRLHVTENGCFYTCRKLLRNEFKDDPASWQRHDERCNWVREEHELFDKPINWDEIEVQCVNALKSVGLDFGAIDLKVQSATTSSGERREWCDFIVIEINSAPSFGSITEIKYKEILPNLLTSKFEKLNEI